MPCCNDVTVKTADSLPISTYTPVYTITHLTRLNYLLLQTGKKMDFHFDKFKAFYGVCHGNKSLLGYYTTIIFITQPLNSKVSADGWS
jgi:hypothetical protein